MVRVMGMLYAPALSSAPLNGVVASESSSRFSGGTNMQRGAKRDAARGGERDVSVPRMRVRKDEGEGWSHRGVCSEDGGP